MLARTSDWIIRALWRMSARLRFRWRSASAVIFLSVVPAALGKPYMTSRQTPYNNGTYEAFTFVTKIYSTYGLAAYTYYGSENAVANQYGSAYTDCYGAHHSQTEQFAYVTLKSRYVSAAQELYWTYNNWVENPHNAACVPSYPGGVLRAFSPLSEGHQTHYINVI
jgi:hypothetical protein